MSQRSLEKLNKGIEQHFNLILKLRGVCALSVKSWSIWIWPVFPAQSLAYDDEATSYIWSRSMKRNRFFVFSRNKITDTKIINPASPSSWIGFTNSYQKSMSRSGLRIFSLNVKVQCRILTPLSGNWLPSICSSVRWNLVSQMNHYKSSQKPSVFWFSKDIAFSHI